MAYCNERFGPASGVDEFGDLAGVSASRRGSWAHAANRVDGLPCPVPPEESAHEAWGGIRADAITDRIVSDAAWAGMFGFSMQGKLRPVLAEQPARRGAESQY